MGQFVVIWDGKWDVMLWEDNLSKSGMLNGTWDAKWDSLS